MLVLPISFFGNVSLGVLRVSRHDCFKSIVSSTEGVLGNMCGCHRLACGTRSQTSRIIFFYVAGGGMGCKRSSAYIRHPKHACANPGSAGFDGFTGPVVLLKCLLKKWKHSFGTVCGPGCH